MLVVGIDENGLGPLLGPLVVTAAAFEVASYDVEELWRVAGSELLADDSKKVFSSSRLGSAEVATLAWLNEFGLRPRSYAELTDAVLASPPMPMPCPLVPGYCLPSSARLPVWASETELGWLSKGSGLLAGTPVRPASVRAFSICPGRFNTALARPGMNKLALDCLLMLRLVRSLASEYSGEVLALCGKVGSTKNYGPWLQDAGLGLWMAEKETPEESRYRVQPLGTVSFIRDGDAGHLPIAVASMIGKYLRELAMRDLNTLLERPGMRRASGYRDKVTAEFVEKTADAREAIGFKDECFLRNS